MTEKTPPGPSLIDRAIGVFNPEAATRRYHARLTMWAATSWAAASRTRPALKQWNPQLRDADGDSLQELRTLRARSHDAMRNMPIARGAVLTNVTSVVGAGLHMRPAIDADALGLSEDQAAEFESEAKRHYRLWALSEFSDANEKIPFIHQQGLAYRSFLEGGDVFVLTPIVRRRGWPFELRTQLIDASRVGNPNGSNGVQLMDNGIEVHNGIEYTDQGKPVAAWIANRHPGAVIRKDLKYRRMAFRGQATGRRNLIHLHEPSRIGESRGVPFLAPVIEPLKQLTRFTDAELAAAVLAAMFTVFLKSEQGIGFGGVDQQTQATNGQRAQYAMGQGAIVQLAAGQDPEFANPSRPNDSFDPFVQAILRQVGVALEVPFELLIKHFPSSYTAARATMQEAWRTFNARRTMFSRGLCDPVWDLLLEEMVLKEMIVANGFVEDPVMRHAYAQAKWIGPPRGQINEKVETDSAILRVEHNLSTLDDETAMATGGDWEANVRQRITEKRATEELTPSAPTPPDDGADDNDQIPGSDEDNTPGDSNDRQGADE